MTALNTFQWRQGLRQTEGVLDAVTLNMLGLTAMGPEIFQPLSGPQCPVDDLAEPPAWCEIPRVAPGTRQRGDDALLITLRSPVRISSRLIATTLAAHEVNP